MTDDGVWTNPRWSAGDPGAFAVVIGVSRYDHLPGGGQAIAPETFGLPQLNVCALTAYRFFQWLRDCYVTDGVRLAKCWLLLSPTEDEVRAEPGLADWPRPTFPACEQAVQDWYATMVGLEAASAGSRSLFFFTGHGLEVTQDRQVLLPCDYLRPPAALVNRALSTSNLLAGMAGLNVPAQLFFIDACRSDHLRFRELGLQLTGTEVLNETGAAWAASDVVAPILYATGTGAQAFQPLRVEDGLSIFGRALIEGVSEPPAQLRTCDGDTCHVLLFDLFRYVSARVPALLATFGAAVTQPVRLGGRAGLVTVTDIAPDVPASPLPPGPAQTLQRTLSFSASLPSTVWGRLDGDATQVADVFGDGPMTGMWAGHTWSTASGEPVRHELVSVARQELSAYRIVVRLPDAGQPTVFRAADGQAVLSCRVPALGPDAVLRLDAVRGGDDGERWHLAVAVDPSAPGLVGDAASAWLRYQDGDLAAAVQESASLFQPVLDGKSPSAFPALVAALVRLRAGLGDSLGWLPDIVEFYPAWPDFRILLGEVRLRAAPPTEIAERAAAAVATYAPPYAAETLSYGAAHAAVVRRHPSGNARPTAVSAAGEVIAALDALQPGGQFCVFVN